MDRRRLTALDTARAASGLAHVVSPGLGSRVVAEPFDARARQVIRVLGVRQVAQAAVTHSHPTAAVLRLGAAADLAHAVSMVGLGVWSRRWRRAALADAAIAAGFAVTGLIVARGTAAAPPGRPDR